MKENHIINAKSTPTHCRWYNWNIFNIYMIKEESWNVIFEANQIIQIHQDNQSRICTYQKYKVLQHLFLETRNTSRNTSRFIWQENHKKTTYFLIQIKQQSWYKWIALIFEGRNKLYQIVLMPKWYFPSKSSVATPEGTHRRTLLKTPIFRIFKA